VRTITILILLFSLSSCHRSSLMEESILVDLASRESAGHQILLYSREFVVQQDGALHVTTRQVLQAGVDLKSFPGLISVFDSPTEPLEEFEARLVGPNGSARHFDRTDLSWTSLNTVGHVSTVGAFYLPIDGQVQTGDIVETVTRHRPSLPQLGISFCPSDASAPTRLAMCVIDIPEAQRLRYKVMNDTLSPVEIRRDGRRRYEFVWRNVVGSGSLKPFTKRNAHPTLLAVVPGTGIESWQDFGDWYLRSVSERLEITPEMRTKAIALTAGVTDPSRKMAIISSFCQNKVRYGQVYLERGEILPSPVALTFARGFGDCKDYSALMWTLATACGVTPSLALCYRGRGTEVQDDLPILQFNHMVVCLQVGDSVTWYDGTNQMPFAGVVSYDIVNSPALVLRPGGSYCTRIPEDRGNSLDIAGSLGMQGSGLAGTITISLRRQYAIDLLYASQSLHEAEFHQVVLEWVRRYISSLVRVRSVTTLTREQAMIMNMTCEIPNCVLGVPPDFYLSASRVFDMLLPELDEKTAATDVYYYPHFGRVDIRVGLPDLDEEGGKHGLGSLLDLRYDIPIGPLEPKQRDQFSTRYVDASRAYTRTRHYTRENP
jgi:hypothetical protein